MAQVHPLLTRAKSLCEEFAVRPCERGFVIWRNRDWSHPRGGWRPDAYASSRETAEEHLLGRFALGEPKEETPPAVTPETYFDFYGGFL